MAGIPSLMAKLAALGTVAFALAGCNMFGSPKITAEPIVPPDQLYQSALDQMDEQHYMGAVDDLKKLERQHPYSDFNEKAKMMEIFANYRAGKLDDAALGATWTMSVGGRPVSTMTRGAMLRTILLNHWYHHRGQLTVYLRQTGALVPSVYGASADELPPTA